LPLTVSCMILPVMIDARAAAISVTDNHGRGKRLFDKAREHR